MKLSKSARVIAEAFVPFLQVHPYANGNGHIARFITVALMQRAGFQSNDWTIHPRPAPDDMYREYLEDGDRGDYESLARRLARSCAASALAAAG